MKVLVTGSNGFIGKNLIESLSHIKDVEICKYNRNSTNEELINYLKDCDFIFHLAGVNRPERVEEFYEGNSDLTEKLIKKIEGMEKKIPFLLSSSTQVKSNSDYGKSKLKSEKLLRKYSEENDVPVFIYRLPNVFGKWCQPNYNSVVATWCYNLTRDKSLKVNDENIVVDLVYIDDVVNSFVKKLYEKKPLVNCLIGTLYQRSLGEILSLLKDFNESRNSLVIPNVGEGFERALYGTYLSYLPTNKFSYELKGHSDNRGTFYEILKTMQSGQFSISTTKAGDIVRGNHYHNTKNEKFLVVKGKAIIEQRNINSSDVIKYKVSDKKMEIVEMIPGYTHNIRNISDEEMVLIIWANEVYDHNKPDTYFLKV